jgi:CheY-like chemotaxis protein
LAEDNPDDAAIARRVFEASPRWEMVAAGDGQQALGALCRRGASSDESVRFPDLVLLNLQMPERTGHEVLEAMKADPKLDALPVVIWSVSNPREDIEHARRRRADAHLCEQANAQRAAANLVAIRRLWEWPLYPEGGRS